MIVAIVGSRNFKDLTAVVDYVLSLPEGTLIVSGGAKGVDSVAADAARIKGLVVREYLADWENLGKAAGFIRNKDIVAGAERVVAFWDGTSKGTLSSINLAKQMDKPLAVVKVCESCSMVRHLSTCPKEVGSGAQTKLF
jgi:hypothetical protein